MPDVKLTCKIDMTEIDEAIKRANRLVELLQEASTIVDSLSGQKIKLEVDGHRVSEAVKRDLAFPDLTAP